MSLFEAAFAFANRMCVIFQVVQKRKIQYNDSMEIKENLIRGGVGMKQDRLIQLFLKELQDPKMEQSIGFELCPDMGSEEYRVSRLEHGYLIRGGDEKGIAYGIQSLAERLKKGSADMEITGSPEVKVRGVDRFIMNTDDEAWWLTEEYWEQYIQMLALSRMNRLCFATGFDTEYLSPPYPFFVDVEGFEDVHLAYEAAGNQKRLQMLRRIGQICHSYHVEFSFAIWQQQPWQKDDRQLIYGLEDENRLCEYCAKGVQALLTECPEIDIMHYRVNYESGVGSDESAEEYWLKQIDAVAEVNRNVRPIRLELRAKGMTDRMVQRGCDQGLDVTVSTKYCCEQAGLPHHLTQMRGQELKDLDNMNAARRYSYADMIRKPRNYHFLYRLWSNGSLTLFNWGDPDYVRRFAASMQLGDAVGFELMVPLTMRGGREFDRHTGWKLFRDERYQPDFEDGRYWLFYRLFGRIGYDSACDESAWMQEMQKRLGDKAELAEKIVALSSKILPFITAFHFPEHPQLWYWPEMNTGAALFKEHNHHYWFKKEQDTYQDSQACDEGLFVSISDFVKDGDGKGGGETFAEEPDCRYTPFQVYDWLNQIVEKLDKYLEGTAEEDGNWEWNGILLDARMTESLARFHMHKILAAMGLAHYQYRQDGSYLADALQQMKLARKYWNHLSCLGDAYHEHLDFSAGACSQRQGHWRDYCSEIDMDIAELERLAKECSDLNQLPVYKKREKNEWKPEVVVPKHHKAGENLEIQVKCQDVDRLWLLYRHTNHVEGVHIRKEMRKTDTGFAGMIDGEYLTSEWDLMVMLEAKDASGDGMIWPGIGNPEEPMPYWLVKVE